MASVCIWDFVLSFKESETVFDETEEVLVNENVELNSHNVANETESIIAGNSEMNKEDEP